MPIASPPSAIDSLPDSLRSLARRGELRRYRKRTVLIQEGEQGDTLFIIVSGRLRVFASGDKGREITYGTYGPGEYVGEMSLDGGSRSATVITEASSDCVVVTRRTLLQHIAERPEFALELLAKVIRRARAATLSAKQLALNDVYGRLVMLLDSLAMAQPNGARLIGQRLTHQAMANRLGCSREMVSRLMKDLETGGYVAPSPEGLALLRVLPVRW
ncbi:Crp/Fnr family transcriptional regulator [Piscinibacter sp.]|uniref:Crp/Fnr family transcriptional regulator n=1 Tax=Piscinibacter sp. TaxID=1903157 RepID=UPI002C8F0CAC|nr:cyclic nucleotide-binding domain-containing protein [Albitalea sp.]HUG22984.1 cyclic nucleotide-binding domain-containing protein [Albitalea sp.]